VIVRQGIFIILPLLALLAALFLPGCAYLETDPILAKLERSKRNAKPLPTPVYRMSPAEAYPDNPQAQALVKAAIKGDVKGIDRLIDAGADPNAVGAYGKTVPGWVLYHPNKAGFKRLLERGADPNIIWYDGKRTQYSLLHLATYMSDRLGIDYLKMCLDIGKGNPNLEPPDRRERPIAVAVEKDNIAALFLLEEHGAGIHFVMHSGDHTVTLAEHAAGYRNYRILLYLLNKGVLYNTAKRTYDDMHSLIESEMFEDFARTPKSPSYMWFWRCVDLLEKRGMKFHYGIAIRPAVLDTTPPDDLGKAHQPQ
jgi:ankyrin repeat protein